MKNNNYEDKYNYILQGVLMRIRQEMDRLYYNKNQKEMNSPFENTGNSYKNDIFTVRAYYWGDDEKERNKPNFKYKGLKIRWYKHMLRGFEYKSKKPLTIEFLNTMINDCIESIRKDFGEEND